MERHNKKGDEFTLHNIIFVFFLILYTYVNNKQKQFQAILSKHNILTQAVRAATYPTVLPPTTCAETVPMPSHVRDATTRTTPVATMGDVNVSKG